MWSYPNTFIDKKDGTNKIGKELADLLVVCGDDVIIFSDKEIEWPDDPEALAWARWYRRAIAKSVDQLRGAERWIRDFPKRIFLDRECTRPFPIELPALPSRRVHSIVVAVGASEACVRHFGGGIGTLFLQPSIKGEQHYNSQKFDVAPFRIGDVDPEGGFVHVFDPVALDIVLSELDTISDFAEYLTKREILMRSGRLNMASGEEDLLALFLKSADNNGHHEFVKPDGTPWKEGDQIVVKAGIYDWLTQQPDYLRRKEANRPSYAWDSLIDLFVDNVIAGTSVELLGHPADTSMSERGLRVMAKERRLYRRVLGGGVREALRLAEEQGVPRFARRFLPGPTAKSRTTGYVFLILAYPATDLEGGYAQYRNTRSAMLEAYCLDLFEQSPSLEVVVGIGVDASEKVTKRKGASEDLLVMEMPEWTDGLRQHLRERQEHFNIRKLGDLPTKRHTVDEYPSEPTPNLSRQQRRSAMRALAKGRLPD